MRKAFWVFCCLVPVVAFAYDNPAAAYRETEATFYRGPEWPALVVLWGMVVVFFNYLRTESFGAAVGYTLMVGGTFGVILLVITQVFGEFGFIVSGVGLAWWWWRQLKS